MKTSDELWRWIWEEDEVIDDRVLAGLVDGADVPLPPPPPAPEIRTEDLWEWLTRDEPLLEADPLGGWTVPGERAAPTPYGEPAVFLEPPPDLVETPVEPDAVVETEAPAAPIGPREEPEVAPLPGEGQRTGRTEGRWYRFGALVLVAAVAGAVAPRVLPASLRPEEATGPGVVAPPDQTVVAWSVVDDDRGLAFVAVLGAGVRDPVAVAVPSDMTISLPGQGLGTMREAAVESDRGLMRFSLENVLGVSVDSAAVMTIAELGASVDAGGTIEVADQAMNGPAVVGYLTAPEAAELPDERFLRWQDVLDALLHTVAARPEAAGAFPEPLGTVLAASSPEPADLLALPVVDLGAGIIRPDEKEVRRLVAERFLPLGADEIRLVVLNGVGEPGIGEEVARTLIPHGFRLVSSMNANRFDYKVTRIIAATEEDVPSAEMARDLLGAGQILLGAQPQLADVIVVVGRDFAGGR